jgi:hypothetical protein
VDRGGAMTFIFVCFVWFCLVWFFSFFPFFPPLSSSGKSIGKHASKQEERGDY